MRQEIKVTITLDADADQWDAFGIEDTLSMSLENIAANMDCELVNIEVCEESEIYGNNDSNTRLIAAAPELLGIAKQILRDLEDAKKHVKSNEPYDIGRYDGLYQLSGLAREAIAKAE